MLVSSSGSLDGPVRTEGCVQVEALVCCDTLDMLGDLFIT